VFEGLFSPAHLAILAVIVFVVMGPRKIMRPFQGAAARLRQLGEDEPDPGLDAASESQSTSDAQGPSRSFAYRFARRLRGGRRP
jgi:Sec-independent protein translocase protein TatA